MDRSRRIQPHEESIWFVGNSLNILDRIISEMASRQHALPQGSSSLQTKELQITAFGIVFIPQVQKSDEHLGWVVDMGSPHACRGPRHRRVGVDRCRKQYMCPSVVVEPLDDHFQFDGIGNDFFRLREQGFYVLAE